jgi:hypothetical protein
MAGTLAVSDAGSPGKNVAHAAGEPHFRELEPVLRKKSRRDRLKPVLVMETGENGFRHDPMSVRKLVIDRP